jgi:hypothetical protein
MTDFTDKELLQLHRYCLKYRDLVRSGSTPTALQDLNFMSYQTICYEQGVAHE